MENFRGLAISVAGYSHIRKKKTCQDASRYIKDKNYEAIIVCDGHGGDKHFRSEIGAKCAIDICKNSISEFAQGVLYRKENARLKELFEGFIKFIIFAWREAINKHYEQNPFSNEELKAIKDKESLYSNPCIAYGSTFILATIIDNNMLIAQLGDGDVRIYTQDKIYSPLKANDRNAFGKTVSLCNSDAANQVIYKVIKKCDLDACIISTDGVINSFETEAYFNEFCKTAAVGLMSDKYFEIELTEFLPTLSENGSGDDVSIAMIAREYN